VTFRDGDQSIFATRMTRQTWRIAPEMNRIGFHSMEVWGARLDCGHRFLNEDPGKDQKFSKFNADTPCKCCAGQNLVGYRHYADDSSRLLLNIPRK